MKKEIIGQEKYFVHKGTWNNNYEWRIQKVKITGLKIDRENKEFAEFSFACCGYEYPVSYLKDTEKEAEKFAIEQINEEKKEQIRKIKETIISSN
jgi:hypothetical protein